MQQTTVGFIGLGAMGGPMARNLLAAGYPVWAYDIYEARAAACREAGARGWRRRFAWYCQRVLDGTATEADVKSPELFLFLAEAARLGCDLPLTRALQQVVEEGTKEPQGLKNPRISYWHELMERAWE